MVDVRNLPARRDIRIATPSSSVLPSSTIPSTSCFRSFSSPTDASFASSSWDAATVHMGTDHQLTGSHITGISTANISLSGRRKLSLNEERPQNEADPFTVPSSTAGLDEHYRNGIGLRRKFKTTGQGPFRCTSILHHKLSWSAAFMRTCNMS